MAFKQLQTSTRGGSTLDVSLGTEAIAPFPTAAAVPTVEWRLKAFAGDWRVAAQVYKDWMNTNRPPVPGASHAWLGNIRTVVGMFPIDPSMLDTLATILVPSETLIYLINWRTSAYDVNYPDYTPAAGVSDLVNHAHALGFKVMLHTDMIGATPGNPDFATVQAFQVKTPDTLQLFGWMWSAPPST